MNVTAAASSPSPHGARDVPQFLLLSSSPNILRDDSRCRFVFDTDAAFDGVIVVNGHRADDVEAIVRRSNDLLLPIANLSEAIIPFADFQVRGASQGRLEDAVDILTTIAHSVRRLPDGVRRSEQPETILLARAHSRNGTLAAVYDPGVSHLVSYPAAGLIEEPWRHAERLADQGLLQRTFFDRLHRCRSCGSSRFNVREECVACRSPDLVDETTVHHFRCAHQGVEGEFRRGEKLVCPKCRHELRHFGVDYDRPGLATVCRTCGHVDADSAVGFVCMDCGSKQDAQAVATRDWYAYRITRAGETALLSGRVAARRSETRDALATFQLLVRHGQRLQARYGKPVTILRITFAKADQVQEQHGERALAQARAHALEVVRGEVRSSDTVLEAEDDVLVYMPETEARDTAVPHRRLIDRIHSTLRVNLGAEASLVSAEELSTLLPDLSPLSPDQP
ncbi:MAG: hypothetical protein ACFCUO_08195 [Rhodospirillales bacterium]